MTSSPAPRWLRRSLGSMCDPCRTEGVRNRFWSEKRFRTPSLLPLAGRLRAVAAPDNLALWQDFAEFRNARVCHLATQVQRGKVLVDYQFLQPGIRNARSF